MPDIVLTTLNAKFIHAAFGLRYLFANLGPLQSRACLVEFDINQRPLDIAEVLLARNPRIIGFGIYIWNVAPTCEVIAAIKRVQPEVKIILGGPEVSYETEAQEIVRLADHVITGEADLKFAEVCRALVDSETSPARQACPHPDPLHEPGNIEHRTSNIEHPMKAEPSPHPDPLPSHPMGAEREQLAGATGHSGDWQLATGSRVQCAILSGKYLPKIIPAELPDFSQIILPYDLYTDEDIAHRIVYVEASRGCPFTCEFCLSSLDIPVRQVPLENLLAQLQRLLERGLKQFKFVDRTFNLNVAVSKTILEFFLARYQPGHFFHFEMVPDRLPESLREVIARFPPGALQFEVGVQTFNEEVGAAIKRRQDYRKLADNFHFLRNHTGVHIHADLIVGLPGETLESFAAGFDRLIALGPQEIQVGILKRLRGTPIVRHDDEWGMIYNPHPPYEILSNQLIDFATLQRLRRFARYWDLVGNSGNFVESTPLIWSAFGVPPSGGNEGGGAAEAGTPSRSPFHAFLNFSDWLYARTNRTDSIALVRLLERLFEYLTSERRLDARLAAETLWRDYQRGGRRDQPSCLKEFLAADKSSTPLRQAKTLLPKRQARHLGQRLKAEI